MEHIKNDMATFYIDCAKAYHDTAKQSGYVQNDMVHIPALLPIGQKTTLAFLQDSFLQSEFSHDPETYYYVVMTFVLQCGIIFADKWHSSMDHLKNTEFVVQVIKDGPWDYAAPILKEKLKITEDNFNLFCRHIYDDWLRMLEPYWSQQDPRDYTFHATLAAFQLGVSTILDQYGIKS